VILKENDSHWLGGTKVYKVSDSVINNTINDFIVFCEFVDEKKPILTKSKKKLGKKDLFELNSKLLNKVIVNEPKYQQESYPVIDFMHSLASLGKLYLKTNDGNGNIILAKTTRKDEFFRLNIFEKYAFLFETFWLNYDFNETNILTFYNNYLDKIIKVLSMKKPGDLLVKGAFSDSIMDDPIFSYYSVIIQYLSYFGLCDYLLIKTDKKLTRFDCKIGSITTTELGVNLCRILVNNSIIDWNIPWLKRMYSDDTEIIPGITNKLIAELGLDFNRKKEINVMRKLYGKRIKSDFIPLRKYLEPIFPKGVLNRSVTSALIKDSWGNYVFKVSLDKDIWRKIMLSHKQTLLDLHLTIQKAFDFDNDHLYAFYMDGKRYSRQVYNSIMNGEGPYVDDAVIGELEIYQGQKILYLFDFGDSWKFEVELLKIINDDELVEESQIVEIKGEAPDQYQNYDD
jgi:hypothetical protein